MLIRTVVGRDLRARWPPGSGSLGVDFAPFWGVLFFLLNYLPNIGSIIAGIPPTVLAFVQLGLGWGLLAAGGLIVLEQVIGNFLDPQAAGPYPERLLPGRAALGASLGLDLGRARRADRGAR